MQTLWNDSYANIFIVPLCPYPDILEWLLRSIVFTVTLCPRYFFRSIVSACGHYETTAESRFIHGWFNKKISCTGWNISYTYQIWYNDPLQLPADIMGRWKITADTTERWNAAVVPLCPRAHTIERWKSIIGIMERRTYRDVTDVFCVRIMAGVCRPCDTIELTATSCKFSLCRRVEKVCVDRQLLRYSWSRS